MLGVSAPLKNNGNQKNEFRPTVFSSIFFSNKDGVVDKTRINYSYWAGLLKISIQPNIPETEEFDSKNAIALHLSVPKAYILLKEIEKFEEDVREGRNSNFFYGVDTPKGLIGISDGSDFGYPGKTVLVIRRMNESEITSTYAYEFKTNGFYYGVRNFKEENNVAKSFDKSAEYDDLELNILKMHLSEYVKAMTMANAYATVDASRYQDNQTYTSLNQIKESLGIEVKRRSIGTGDFFKSGGASAPRSSYSSIGEATGNIVDEQEDVEL